MKKSNAFTRFVLGSAGIFLALMLVTSIMEAQCPPCSNDIQPILGCDWTFVSGLIYNGPNGCTGTVSYCYRSLYNWPVKVDTDGNPIINPKNPNVTIQCQTDTVTTNCDSLFEQLIDSASDYAFRDASHRLGYTTPCDTAHSQYYGEGYYSSCWKLIQTSPNAFVSCHDSSDAWCETRCAYCPYNGLLFDCINIQEGTPSCGGGSAPSKFNLWLMNSCYQVICGTHLH